MIQFISPRAAFQVRQLILSPSIKSISFSKRSLSVALKKEVYIDRLTGEDQGIAVLTLNRPQVKNALGKVMVSQFQECVETLRFDKSARVVILKSQVPGAFCVGADLKERASMSPAEVERFVFSLRSLFTSVENLPMPTIAAIDGFALGGGLELALAADLRVAGAKAKMGLVETKLAIIPGAGGTQRLPRVVGVPKAKELIFTASVLTGTDAASIGLVNHVTSEDSKEAMPAYEKALSLARSVLPNGPVALRMAKQAIQKGSEVDIATGMALEQAYYAQIIPTKDRIEGLTAFKENRKPVYIGE